MGLNISNIMIARRIQQLLRKNQIEVLHHLPGRIRLRSPHFKREAAVTRLVEELKQDPKILSVTYTKEVGSLLILFDNSLASDYGQIELWMVKVDQALNP
jgi:hypothetical protein